MVFYVSIRPVLIDGKRLLSPKYMLRSGFVGMPLKFKCIASNPKNDGRWLYEIETDTEEYKDVILEGLRMWGVHLKTLNSAKSLAEKLIGKTIEIDGDRLCMPTVDIESMEK